MFSGGEEMCTCKCLEFSRYVLDSLEEKVLKGKYGFIAQLNPNRYLKNGPHFCAVF